MLPDFDVRKERSIAEDRARNAESTLLRLLSSSTIWDDLWLENGGKKVPYC